LRLSGSLRNLSGAVCALLVALVFGCSRSEKVREVNYVSGPQVTLRDRVAAMYNKVGVAKNGERVEVLERDRRFARVRTASGIEGWVEQRYLVPKQVYDDFQKLTQANQNAPVQAPATTRNDTNLHLEPGRESEHLYQLAAGEKLAILKRDTAEKQLPGGAPAMQVATKKDAAGPVMEDWWLARDSQGKIGWVLGRMVDIDVPLEIAQYAEGQRFVAFFVLNKVKDDEKEVPQYLAAITEPKDGLPFDYNQVRVFTWNVRRHRYETAYRERGLDGVLPVTVGRENFDKDGELPIFVLRVKDDAGNVVERKYKLNTPIVRRVLAPGEEKELGKKRPAVKRRTK
jgi:SH3-like domain-containing protein